MLRRTKLLLGLDLICCGLAGAVVLLLITAAARDPQQPSNPRRPALVVQATVTQGPAAELRLEVKAPGSQTWRALPAEPRAGAGFSFAAAPEQGGGGVALFVLPQPRPGRWSFRVFYADYAGSTTPPQARLPPSALCTVRLEAFGPNPEPEALETRLARPGTASQPLSLHIQAIP